MLRLIENFHVMGSDVKFSIDAGDNVVILLDGDATIDGVFMHSPQKFFMTKLKNIEVHCDTDCNFSILKELG